MRLLTKDEQKAVAEVRGLCQQWSRGGEARVAAQDRLIALGPRSSEHILAVLDDHEQPNRRRLLLFAVFTIWTAVSFSLYRLAGLISHTKPPGIGLAITQAGAITLALAVGMSLIHRNYTHILTIFNDVRTIPALLHGLSLGKPEISSAIRNSLIRLLPLIRPQDSGLSTDDTLSILCNELSTTNSLYGLSIISSLDVIGTANLVTQLEELLSLSGGSLRNDPTVRDAASALLASLQDKKEAERISSTLLRAADSPEVPFSVLLRVASDTTQPDQRLLLRPTDPT